MKISRKQIKELGINEIKGIIPLSCGKMIVVYAKTREYVIWRYNTEKDFHKSKVIYGALGIGYFKVGYQKYFLDSINKIEV